MRVLLPDSTELELPDGSTGLDAAAAIGPKLAEQAVLVRSNGRVQDLRLPLEDGQPIQILTTRDTNDPDALYVLRHSAAHLLAEAVRRLYPGDEDRDRPADRERLLLRLRVPGADRRGGAREDRGRDPARARRGPRVGARGGLGRARRRSSSRRRARSTRSSSSTRPRATISLYTQGDFTDLCRGPHLQDSKPIKALKLTGLAGAYWRGDENNKQLTRIYGTAFYSQADLDAYLERLEEAKRRDHRRLGTELDLFHLSDHAPGMPFWHPEGDGPLERARGAAATREPEARLRRGARRRSCTTSRPGRRRATGRSSRTTCSCVPYGEDRTLGLKPMNCPGHMLLFGNALRSYRELPLRYAEASTLHRNERAGTLHGLLRVQHVTQDDAHIFVTPEQIEDEIFGALDFAALPVRPVRHGGALRARRRGRTTSSARTRSGTSRRPRSRSALRPKRDRRTRSTQGDGAFYGPKIDLHMTDVLGRSWQMGTIQLDSQMPARFGLTYVGEDNAEHTPYVVHRALFGSLERFMGILIEHYGGAFPVWLAPVQVRIVPVGEDHREAAGATGREARRVPRRGRRLATRRSASGSATRRSRRSRTWSSGATRSRRTRSPSASTAESSPRSRLDELLGELARGC